MNRQLDINISNGQIGVDLWMNGAPTSVVKGLSEDKLREYYQSKILHSKPEIMPPAVRYLSSDRRRLIWERPPGFHTINYSPVPQNKTQASSESKVQYRIPVPWQVYLICFNEDYVINTMYMFFRNSPLIYGDTTVGYPPLNNFYRDGKLCQAVYDHMPDASNLFQMLDNAYNMVWNSGFNEDLHDTIDVAFTSNNDKSHPLLCYPEWNNRLLLYKKWASISLQKMVGATWPQAYPDAMKLLDSHAAGSDSIRTVEFIMDIQSA